MGVYLKDGMEMSFGQKATEVAAGTAYQVLDEVKDLGSKVLDAAFR